MQKASKHIDVTGPRNQQQDQKIQASGRRLPSPAAGILGGTLLPERLGQLWLLGCCGCHRVAAGCLVRWCLVLLLVTRVAGGSWGCLGCVVFLTVLRLDTGGHWGYCGPRCYIGSRERRSWGWGLSALVTRVAGLIWVRGATVGYLTVAPSGKIRTGRKHDQVCGNDQRAGVSTHGR